MAEDDIYRLSVSAQYLGMYTMNTFAFRQKVATITPADVNTLAIACKELFRGQQGGAFTYRTYRAVQVWGGGMTTVASECRREGGVVFEGNFTSNTGGGFGTGDFLPPQSALVITLNTGKVGRRFRGRLYGCGFIEAQQADGLWTASTIIAQQALVTTFEGKYKVGGTDPTWELGVWSERIATGCEPNPNAKGLINVEPPHPELAYTGVASLIVKPTVYSQRRRTVGVGR